MPTIDLSRCLTFAALLAAVARALPDERRADFERRATGLPGMNALIQLARQYVRFRGM